MKSAIKGLFVLAAGGLLMGSMVTTPAVAGDKKEETDIIKIIDKDLQSLDKALFGWLTPKK